LLHWIEGIFQDGEELSFLLLGMFKMVFANILKNLLGEWWPSRFREFVEFVEGVLEVAEEGLQSSVFVQHPARQGILPRSFLLRGKLDCQRIDMDFLD